MASPRDGTATLRGLPFHWLDWGTAGGSPVLLLHGVSQTAHSWDEVAPGLAQDHHVLALDQRGHGDSGWATDGVYRRSDFVEDVAALLDHQGWPATTLVALSMGGLNAIAFAAAHPERLRGLVVVDVAPTIERTGREEIGRQLFQREFASFDEAVEHAHAFNPRRTLENIRDRMHHTLRRLPDGRWTYKFDPRVFGGVEGELDRLWNDVRTIRCPALLVRGAESHILAAETAERFRRELPGSTVATVPGAGHSVMGDNPAGFLAAVRPFLVRHGL